jgi:predicted PurR-regulated permease PerM
VTLATLIAREGTEFYTQFATDGQQWRNALRRFVTDLPVVGVLLSRLFEAGAIVDMISASGEAIAGMLAGWARLLAQGITGYTLAFAVYLIALFFMFRDGAAWTIETRRGVSALFGSAADRFEGPLCATVQGITSGWLITSLLQGLVAGLGYWVAGAPAPLTFTVATALAALIPFGATVIWVAVCALLLGSGSITAAVGLAVWGIVVVSTVDNIARPWIVTSTVKLHFMTVFIGMLGGLVAFGLLGLFVGPVVLVALGLLLDELTLQRDG